MNYVLIYIIIYFFIYASLLADGTSKKHTFLFMQAYSWTGRIKKHNIFIYASLLADGTNKKHIQ